jgi:hypothetical protein
LEDAENDSQELKVKRWGQIANNAEQWASVINEVKILGGW